MKNVTKHELIGLTATVSSAKNKANVGIHGKIIDETKSMIMIETKTGIKKIVKKDATIDVLFRGKKIRIKGEVLVGRPEERIKQ